MNYTINRPQQSTPVKLIDADQLILESFAIQDAYDTLIEDHRLEANALGVIENVELAISTVNRFGVTEEVLESLGVEDLCEALDCNVKDMSEYQVMEGLLDAVKDAWGKFVEMIKKFAAHIKEFFQKLFNTTTKKAKVILEAIKNKQIDYDKEVNIISSSEATELTGAADALSAFSTQYVAKSWSAIIWLPSICRDAKSLAGKYTKFMEASDDGTSIKFKDDAIKPEKKALKAAGYGDSNISAICNSFMNSQTSSSRIGDALIKVANSVSSVTTRAEASVTKPTNRLGEKTTQSGSETRSQIKSAYNVISSAHNAQMKCQRMRAAVISAVYSCVKEKGTGTPEAPKE